MHRYLQPRRWPLYWRLLLPHHWRRHVARKRLARGQFFADVPIEGLRLTVDLRDWHGPGRHMFTDRRYEPAETRFVRRAVRAGMTVLDLGANLGYFTSLFSRLVGADGHVWAFEPEPFNFRLLQQNVARNGSNNADCVPCALSDRPGVANLYMSDSNRGDHRLYASEPSRQGVRVEVTTLDAFVASHGLERINMIKMDVQGFEGHVLRGARRCVDLWRGATLLMEFWPYGLEKAGDSAESMLELLRECGFRRCGILANDGHVTYVPWSDILKHVPTVEQSPSPGQAAANLVFEHCAD